MTPVGDLVSVIVPTRNSDRTLRECLTSVRAQSYESVEVIVIDNRSSDQTLRIARENADLVDIWGPERSAQRNRGAALARGEFLLFVDSDMTLTTQVVGDCVDVLKRTG